MSKVNPVLRVLFLCRGSLRDGLGHVIRSRTLALEMARRAAVQMIVIGDKYVDALLVGYGLNYQLFFEDTMLLSTLEEFKPHVVVFDMVYFPKPELQAIKKQAMTVSLSPIFNCLDQTDLFFHRTVYNSDDLRFIGGRRRRSGLGRV